MGGQRMEKHERRTDLRRRAGGMVRRRLSHEALHDSRTDARRLLERLEIPKTELTRQHEISSRSRLEQERNLARYTELFDFAPMGYATLDGAGTIRDINRAGAMMLQVERPHMIGRPFIASVAAHDRGRFAELVKRAGSAPGNVQTEIELSTPKAPLYARLTAARSRSSASTVLIVFLDLTERKRHVRELRQREAALREAATRKDEFVAMLSHELRNPLTPIRNSLFLLARGESDANKSRRLLALVERQVSHVSRLLDDLLDARRIHHGELRLQTELLELCALLRQTLQDQSASFEAAGIRLEVMIEPSDIWVRADPARLTQVLVNVLGNAAKFTPRGGVVSVTLRRSAEGAMLSVRDTGSGIAPELLERMFEPFRQAPQSCDRAHAGLGLGLSIVRLLVELHGGRACMTSRGLGYGSELTITLPETTAPPQTASSKERPNTHQRRIFIVEDNIDAADTLKAALTLLGHTVEVTYDGTTACAQARAFHPDIVLCDVGLPRMNGYAVARAFRADEQLRTAYLVALSGYALPRDLRRAEEAGFNLHVAKPSSIQQLARVIDAAPQAGA